MSYSSGDVLCLNMSTGHDDAKYSKLMLPAGVKRDIYIYMRDDKSTCCPQHPRLRHSPSHSKPPKPKTQSQANPTRQSQNNNNYPHCNPTWSPVPHVLVALDRHQIPQSRILFLHRHAHRHPRRFRHPIAERLGFEIVDVHRPVPGHLNLLHISFGTREGLPCIAEAPTDRTLMSTCIHVYIYIRTVPRYYTVTQQLHSYE